MNVNDRVIASTNVECNGVVFEKGMQGVIVSMGKGVKGTFYVVEFGAERRVMFCKEDELEVLQK
jgi:hypothetical protein